MRVEEISPEIVLIEPVFYDGKCGDVDIVALSRKAVPRPNESENRYLRRYVNRLIGAANHPEHDLKNLQATTVLRLEFWTQSSHS